MNAKLELPKLYISMPHECSYLPGQIASTLFVDPKVVISNSHYSLLAQMGFRRSGSMVYRPHCEGCRECLAVRVPVATFKSSRSQRRVWTRNQDLVMTKVAPGYREEHFVLYQKYQRVRHTNSSMDSGEPEQYKSFLFGNSAETEVHEFRLGAENGGTQELLAVAIVDKLEDGLSAVYTFFNPSESRRAPGVFSVLYEIELARRLGLPYVYLGYYIADSRKMNYKINYQPLQAFDGKVWETITHR
ncbi:MAG: arginyltransferase [Acidiferrobacterales bacterium]